MRNSETVVGYRERNKKKGNQARKTQRMSAKKLVWVPKWVESWRRSFELEE